ncbi:MAG: DUF5683 domain-containing protein [Cytophagaceae bacterium]|jgi:hypothetical protein|nr:DUF5683 domain-containing protein [Cytophagaceae bacterium]
MNGVRLLIFIFFACLSTASGQSEPVAPDSSVANDTTPRKKWDRPRKAMWMSAALPGLGQVYNRKNFYWKLPIIYGGFSVIYYFYRTNQQGYREFDAYYDEYFGKEASFPGYYSDRTGFRYSSFSQLKTERDTYRRYRDMAVFFGIALYALNVMDAFVEGHLLDFDISDDLSMRWSPVFLSGNNVSFAPGLAMQLRLKHH